MRSFLAALALITLLPTAVPADEAGARPRAVLELFTSQGCSSCPPADALLARLGREPDLIALAYHVDYWDYIGWPDSFAQPAHADLQRAYAGGWHKDRIYTPQLVINGRTETVGSNRSAVHEALEATALSLEVALSVDDGMLDIAIPQTPDAPKARIVLVTTLSQADVAIPRGENRDRTLTYTDIVLTRRVLGMLERNEPTHLRLPMAELKKDGCDRIAILVQEERRDAPGPILGARAINL